MASLTTHLRQAGSHGHLPFRADCPGCCEERLSGTIDDRPLVPRRAQASLAAALLAFSGMAPIPAAAAASPHRAQAADVPAGEEADPNFDPGGNDQLDDPVTPPVGSDPGAGGGDDDTAGEPIDTEPAQDPYLDQLTEEPVEADGGLGPDTPAGGPPPAPASPPPIAPPAPVPPRERPVPEPAPNPTPNQFREDSKRADDRPGRRDRSGKRRSTTQVAPPPDPTTAPLPVSAPPAGESSAANASQAQPRPVRQRDAADSSVHVVQPGESLWSIASDQLEPRASVAAIAREVNRLWKLNTQRIATNDPDLLMVGTVLRLR